MDVKIILLAVGVVLWLASVNVAVDKPKTGRRLQTCATWVFLITLAWKIIELFMK